MRDPKKPCSLLSPTSIARSPFYTHAKPSKTSPAVPRNKLPRNKSARYSPWLQCWMLSTKLQNLNLDLKGKSPLGTMIGFPRVLLVGSFTNRGLKIEPRMMESLLQGPRASETQNPVFFKNRAPKSSDFLTF